jgi:hypothetical protein
VARDRIGVCLLRLGTGADEFLREIRAPANRQPNREVEEEIRAYFAGKITRFSTPLHPQGTL